MIEVRSDNVSRLNAAEARSVAEGLSTIEKLNSLYPNSWMLVERQSASEGFECQFAFRLIAVDPNPCTILDKMRPFGSTFEVHSSGSIVGGVGIQEPYWYKPAGATVSS